MRRLNSNQIVITPDDMQKVVTKVVQLNRIKRIMKDGMVRDNNSEHNHKKSPASVGTPQISSMMGASEKQSHDVEASLIFKGTTLFG